MTPVWEREDLYLDLEILCDLQNWRVCARACQHCQRKRAIVLRHEEGYRPGRTSRAGSNIYGKSITCWRIDDITRLQTCIRSHVREKRA